MAFHEIPEHTPEWYAKRAHYIGGSEISALFGCQPAFADSVFALHYIKSGKVPPDHKSSARAWWGTRKEPRVAQDAAYIRGWRTRKGRYATDDTTPGMAASLDYEITNAGADAEGVTAGPALVDGEQVGRVIKGISGPLIGPGVLQIKIVDWRQHREAWIAEQVPDYIALQVQHELACAGYAWGVIAVEIGGNDLGFYFYEARPLVIDNIRGRVTDFWQGVADGKPPPVDGSEGAARVLRELFPKIIDTSGQPIDLSDDNELPGICYDLATANAERLAAEKREKEAKAKLKLKLEAYTAARCTGWFINCVVSKGSRPRPAEPGEMIGGRAESRKYSVREDLRS